MGNRKYLGSDFNGIVKIQLPNDVFSCLDELYDILLKSGWSEKTVYKKCQWNPNEKYIGQCNVTAILVKEYFNATIYRCHNPKGGAHWFNVIEDETQKRKPMVIDLTSEQFPTSSKPCYEKRCKVPSYEVNWYSDKESTLKERIGLSK